MKNHEERIFAWIYMGVMLLMTFIVKQYTSFFYIVPMVMLLAFAMFYLLLHRKRKQVLELSAYLQQVYQGNPSFDVRDYCEGDMSILKSDLYKITSILQQQADALRKDKTYLADSLSDISHQLKTPLTSMMVVSDLLLEDLPHEKRMEFHALLQTQLKRLEWLVSSLLKMSKIDARAATFHFEPIALKPLLEQSVLAFLIPMELKQQTFTLECDEDIMINADSSWLLEAFSNIVKNGMEHTPQNGELSITVNDTPLHTIISFQDNGTGIDAQDIPHIFERFYKGKDASSDSVGIGLALSRAILIEHGASIQVESVWKEGTTFLVTFHK